MREFFVSELVKEVLGPRGGLREALQDNPMAEYITGVLGPVVDHTERDVDNEAVLPLTESQGGEEATDDIGAALDPRDRPTSMGLTFVLEAEGTPEFDVCITWARYTHGADGQWHREPKFQLKHIRADYDSIGWIGTNGENVAANTGILSFHVRVARHGIHSYLVTLYLVNRVVISHRQLAAEDLVFQPQLRILCGSGTSSAPVVDTSQRDTEDNEKAFLYRDRPLFARGHMCSAVWREIDPESPFPGTVDFEECRTAIPFTWVDGELLEVHDRTRFASPDLRTEFIPLISVPSPDYAWRNEYGPSPQTSAAALSQDFSREQLRLDLRPLIDGYNSWISATEAEASSLGEEHQSLVRRLLDQCRVIVQRLERGLELLYSSEDARLSFCFANAALDLQSRWSHRRSGLIWRPFQLAYFLLALEPIANRSSADREVCDLLWVSTGAGKTEAYLAIIAFALAIRRRRALHHTTGDRTGAGVAVLTRYTLRLLTIQQFRRASAAVTACEFLRVSRTPSGLMGWRPSSCNNTDELLWGSTPFSIGLWVGSGVRPNKLLDTWGGNELIPGAIGILRGRLGEGDPAQITNCPACDSFLAIPNVGLSARQHTISLVVHCTDTSTTDNISRIVGTHGPIRITSAHAIPLVTPTYYTLTLEIESSNEIRPSAFDSLWTDISRQLPSTELCSTRASRPGYFIRNLVKPRGGLSGYEFDIFCPSPDCHLHTHWMGGYPSGMAISRQPSMSSDSHFADGNLPIEVPEAFRSDSPYTSDRVPILAFTTDDQVYHRLPSVVVSTVDKFARPPFEPRASALFGNVTHHHCVGGYYRLGEHYLELEDDGHPKPGIGRTGPNYVRVDSLDPPDLILQDELHLINGPLGSLVGIYEAAVDFLCRENNEFMPKYIASTATVRRAREQVQSTFARRLITFPASGLTAQDRFFVREYEAHSLSDQAPGRLYLGICAPGKGPLTPLVRIWARLLQCAWMQRTQPRIDGFWTLTGYFNAVRELAGARALYRQDIPQWLSHIAPVNARPIPDERSQELSSRTDSINLPAVLDTLSRTFPRDPDPQDALFTTAMFGTGVDISRIGLMVVAGQPKTTSSYIQSTGRVGRSHGALVVTFFRASRPRDLNHYEFFAGYHRQLHRFVEPVTVYPFAPGVLERAAGPVVAFALRNMRSSTIPWNVDGAASEMARLRSTAPEIASILTFLQERGSDQPAFQVQDPATLQAQLASGLDRWQQVAARHPDLRYFEYSMTNPVENPVVLGDPEHIHAGLDVVFNSVPQSLRDIEETTGFQIED